jgi:ATP-dependent Lhr-like helicase
VLIGIPRRYHTFLSQVRVVVLDEIHQVYQTPRGFQLLILLERLKQVTGKNLQRIGLSATIPDADTVGQWMAGSDTSPVIVTVPSQRHLRSVLLSVSSIDNIAHVINDIYQAGKRKVLLFGNTRRACDILYRSLHDRTSFSNRVYLHYSSLSQAWRTMVEKALPRRPLDFVWLRLR